MVRIYLAGPYGFYKFNGTLPCYGKYRLDTHSNSGPPESKGLKLLSRLESDLSHSGFDTFNPWYDTLHPSYYSGVVFGKGLAEDSQVWEYGSLREKSLPPRLFSEWIEKLNLEIRDEEKICVSPYSNYELASAIYEKVVRKIIYQRCVSGIHQSDFLLADFNAYRGSIDIGTYMEAQIAVNLQRKVFILLDESSSIGEGDSPLPLMVDGWIIDNNPYVINQIDSFIQFLNASQNINELSFHSYYR